uniref:F-box domain-containing protein n=1 Tax=Triticum urartu TaxID=4572 RepID=A0A8R7QHJ6_TRIUA
MPVTSVRDWSELPLDALTSVFAGLGAVDVLMGAGLVCHSWLEAAKAPELWRKVDMGRGPRDKEVSTRVMCTMAKVAVDRSNGKLVGANFVTDEILTYVGARSPSLKGLALLSCYHVTSEGFTDLVAKCPLLEDIELSGCVGVRGDVMVATGRACLRLKRLVL